jgi:hypothetical protein
MQSTFHRITNALHHFAHTTAGDHTPATIVAAAALVLIHEVTQ